MRDRYVWLSLLFISLPAYAQNAVHKCTGQNGVTTYQDTPCNATPGTLTLVMTSPKIPEPKSAGPALLTRQESQPGTAFPHTTLQVGMSDTEVLNLKGWGRPGNISRSKSRHGWREDWTYPQAADGPAVLQFTNGILTAANTEDPVSAPESAASALDTMVSTRKQVTYVPAPAVAAPERTAFAPDRSGSAPTQAFLVSDDTASASEQMTPISVQ